MRPLPESMAVSPFHAVGVYAEGEPGLSGPDGAIAVNIEIEGDTTWLVPQEPMPFGAEVVLTVDGRATDQRFATADLAARRLGTTADVAADADAVRVARDSEGYAVPSMAEGEGMREVVARVLAGDWDVDAPLAELGYRWDAAEDDGRWRLVLREPAGTLGRGSFVFAFDASRALVVQAPHPEYDASTGDQAVDAFLALDAAALFLAGSHRCANAESSPCDGTTSACGTTEAFRISDAAHAEGSVFQVVHEGVADAWPASVAVQLHGFGWDGTEPMAYASDGTDDDDPSSVSRVLRDALEAELGVDVASCNDASESSRLCGTTNTQGRYSNASGDVCGSAASAASGRFVHLEQARGLREESREAVLRGLAVLDAPPPPLR